MTDNDEDLQNVEANHGLFQVLAWHTILAEVPHLLFCDIASSCTILRCSWMWLMQNEG